MAFCTGCGHRLSGVGRFCTNCGRPVAAEVSGGDTVQRPQIAVPGGPPPSARPPSSPPPPAYTPPPAPRYPLYADDSGGAPVTAPAPRASAPSAPPQPPTRRSGPSFLAVALIAVILVLVAVIGALLLFSGGDDDKAESPGSSNSASSEESSRPGTEQPSSPSGPPDTPPPSEGSQDIARFATAEAPRTAPPNSDPSGNLVRYDATNMLDGVPTTCWRTQGDGTGLEITFTFAQPVELTEVGLINGYAKSAGKLDWYKGNRRVLAVQWQFDDGTTVDQSLAQTRDIQTMDVGPVTTSTVVLRLTSVSMPGRGPAARNYTPISDVSLVGSSA